MCWYNAHAHITGACKVQIFNTILYIWYNDDYISCKTRASCLCIEHCTYIAYLYIHVYVVWIDVYMCCMLARVSRQNRPIKKLFKMCLLHMQARCHSAPGEKHEQVHFSPKRRSPIHTDGGKTRAHETCPTTSRSTNIYVRHLNPSMWM